MALERHTAYICMIGILLCGVERDKYVIHEMLGLTILETEYHKATYNSYNSYLLII